MVAITEALKYDLTVDVGSYFNGSADESDLVSAYSGTVTILAGELNKSFTPAIDTKTDDVIISSGANATVLAGKGDDAITTGSGSDTITYRQGDGSDVVFDKGGVDTFSFSDINKSDVTLSVEGKDLIVTINATESVTFKNYLIDTNRIENITFADGVKLNYGQIIQEYGVSSSDMIINIIGTNDSISLKNYTNAYTGIENIQLEDGTLVNIVDIQGATEGDDYLTYGDCFYNEKVA